ncbi:DNA polymerase III subunit delta [Thermodesulfobacteriota bacterium]
MAVYKRQKIPKLLSEIRQGVTSQIYLICGERYLCRSAAQELIEHILPEKERQTTSLHHIDGDQEDFKKTLNQLKTFSLFTGPQIIWVTDSKLFYSKGIAKNVWEKACDKKERNETRLALRYLLELLNLAGLSVEDLEEESITSLSGPGWKKLFGFTKPQGDLSWVDELLTEIPPALASSKEPQNDGASQFVQAFESGIPQANTLIILAETVDKRKRLYKYIKEHGVILDLAVDAGGLTAAKRDQEKVLKELIVNTLEKYGKKIDTVALPVLLERIGFHPVAAVMEAEKLALYVADRNKITRDDIDTIIGRTREEALYELTESVTSGKLESGLQILEHLQNNGIHGLAIIATLKNHIEKLLLARSLQELDSPSYTQAVASKFNLFQKNYLPPLKEGRDEWTNMLWKSHPYALFMLFSQAARFRCEDLQNGLKEVLAAEYRMKSTSVDSRIIMDNLLFNLMHQNIMGTGLK